MSVEKYRCNVDNKRPTKYRRYRARYFYTFIFDTAKVSSIISTSISIFDINNPAQPCIRFAKAPLPYTAEDRSIEKNSRQFVRLEDDLLEKNIQTNASVCCKLLESLIRDHIMTYLLENDLLSHRQYGFIKGRSTMLQLLHMFDKWTEYLEGCLLYTSPSPRDS